MAALASQCVVLIALGQAGNHFLAFGRFLDSPALCPGRYLNFSGVVGVTVGAILLGVALILKVVQTIPLWTLFAAVILVGALFASHVIKLVYS
jgi:hypothetical protein